MKYRYIDTVKKYLYITSHEPAFHYSVLEVPAQHRSTPLLQRNIIILHSRAARSGDDHSCPAFAFSYFRARFRVVAFSRFAARFRAEMPRTTGAETHTHFLHSHPLMSPTSTNMGIFFKKNVVSLIDIHCSNYLVSVDHNIFE